MNGKFLIAFGCALLAGVAAGDAKTSRKSADTESAPYRTQGMAIMWASVGPEGTLSPGSMGAVSSKRVANGRYVVKYSRELSFCTTMLDVGLKGSHAVVGPDAFDVSSRTVYTYDAGGAQTDLSFTLLMLCAR